MGNTTDIAASPKLRAMFIVAATVMFALWGWSLVPPIENWGNPNEDGFSYAPLFYTTIVCLPIALCLLIGAIAVHGRHVRRARIAFFIAAGITILVVAFLIVQHIANNNQGKVFGIQIGFRFDHRDALEV
jgi:heme/copper-type cytochrome/quinol oxidase subunit 3